MRAANHTTRVDPKRPRLEQFANDIRKTKGAIAKHEASSRKNNRCRVVFQSRSTKRLKDRCPNFRYKHKRLQKEEDVVLDLEDNMMWGYLTTMTIMIHTYMSVKVKKSWTANKSYHLSLRYKKMTSKE